MRFAARQLTKPLKRYTLVHPNDLAELKRQIRKGDVVLVEGNERISEVIKYLTQSSWSHSALYVGDEAEKQALLLGEPGIFFTTRGYDGWPLVMLRLAEVDTGRLAELVTDAWRMRAPAALADEFDQAGSLPGAEPG